MEKEMSGNVVKYGSETVASRPGVDQLRIDGHVGRLIVLDNLVVVSSGSVMAGKAEAPEIEDEQILAGLGSAPIVMGWKIAFAKYGRLASQVPLTDHEMDDSVEGPILKEAIKNDQDAGIVPIINTNDKLSHKELPKRRWGGENDGVAGHVGILIDAERVFFLTERVEGLIYDGKIVGEIPFSQRAHERALGLVDYSLAIRKGGMESKLSAGISLAKLGIDTYIANAEASFEDIISGKTGTHIAKRV